MVICRELYRYSQRGRSETLCEKRQGPSTPGLCGKLSTRSANVCSCLDHRVPEIRDESVPYLWGSGSPVAQRPRDAEPSRARRSPIQTISAPVMITRIVTIPKPRSSETRIRLVYPVGVRRGGGSAGLLWPDPPLYPHARTAGAQHRGAPETGVLAPRRDHLPAVCVQDRASPSMWSEQLSSPLQGGGES